MPTTLTPDAAAALDGPDWLSERRALAAARAAETAPPSPSEEVWRYSPVAELELDHHHPAAQPEPGVPAAVATMIEAVAERSGLVVLRNGWLVHAELSGQAASAGVTVTPLADLTADEAPSEPDAVDLFGLLSTAHAPSPLLVDVPAGVLLADPIVVVEWVDEVDAAVFTRVHVRLGDDAEVRLLEWQASADVSALAVPVTHLELGTAARLGHLTVQELGTRVWQIAASVSTVGPAASLTAAHAGLGGHYARCRTDCRLEGRGASGTLLALYFGEGEQTLDYRTFQEHVAPDTSSELLYKGAVGGTSRSVYSGLIRVGKEARGTNAFQTNRNIKLSDGAWAESVPNLEIENNDVRCSHASTVGPIDDDQRFYLESRGVPPRVAERLVVAGFFDEVLQRIPVRSMAPLLRGAVDERLSRTDLAAGEPGTDETMGGAR